MDDTDKIINSLGDEILEIFSKMIKNQICFDALEKGWCEHHGGKCSDLISLIDRINLKIHRSGTIVSMAQDN